MSKSLGDIIKRSIRDFEIASIHQTIMPLLLTFAKEGFMGHVVIESRRGTIGKIIEENFYDRIKDKENAKQQYNDYIDQFPIEFKTPR